MHCHMWQQLLLVTESSNNLFMFGPFSSGKPTMCVRLQELAATYHAWDGLRGWYQGSADALQDAY